MNKFEKKALAKRAYRALVKMAEDYSRQQRQQVWQQVKPMFPPLDTPKSRQYNTKDYARFYNWPVPLESEVADSAYMDTLAPLSPAERRTMNTGDKLRMLDNVYNEDMPRNAELLAVDDPNWRQSALGEFRSNLNKALAVNYMSGLGPNPAYLGRNRKPVTGKQVMKHLAPFTQNMKQPINETYPD